MKNWLTRFRHLLELPFTDQILLIKTGAVLLAVRIALIALPLRHVHQAYLKLIETQEERAIPSEVVLKQVWAIHAVSGILKTSCLPQAMALKYFLRFDHAARLMIGVRQHTRFEAHAWVQKQSQILIGDLPQFDYRPLWQWE